jgi:phage shock protein PspC (stress-responsive transcriptional regulator)
MSEFLKKLTSRKFLLAVVGVVSGLAMAFGVEGTEIVEVVSAVGGVITALGSIVAYTAAESRVDAAAVEGKQNGK